MTDSEKLDLLLSEIRDVGSRVNNLENRFDSLESRVDSLEKEVKYNSIITENTIKQCIKVLGEGYQLNADRFDRLDIDGIKTKSDNAFILAKMTNERLDRFIEKMEKSA